MSPRKKPNYISLQEATKYCNYSQEYLSLRARQGKLKAIKIGRNWVTTKKWVKEYFSKNQKTKVTLNKFEKNKKNNNYNLKSFFSFQKSAFIFILIIVFVSVLIPVIGNKPLSQNFIVNTIRYDFPASLDNVLDSFNNSSAIFANKLLTADKKITASLLNGVNKKVFPIIHQTKESIKEKTQKFAIALSQNYNIVQNKLNRTYEAVYSSFVNVYDKFTKRLGRKTVSEQGSADSFKNKGMIVIPSEKMNATVHNSMKKIFPDEIIVEINQDANTEIIKPVFKEDQDQDQEYLFIMVPIVNVSIETENE